MNLDDLISGKVSADSTPAPVAEPIRKEISDLDALLAQSEVINPNLDTKADKPLEPIQIRTPVLNRIEPALVQPPEPQIKTLHLAPTAPTVTPGAPVFGFVSDKADSMYAAKPIPGSDQPGPAQRSQQLVKDFGKISLIGGLLFGAVLSLPFVFGVDLPGMRGKENPPITWFKKATAKRVVAPAPVVAPVKEPIAKFEPTPEPALIAAPAPSAPIAEPAPAMMAAPTDVAPTVLPAVPVAPAKTVKAVKTVKIEPITQTMNLPPPPPPVAMDGNSSYVGMPTISFGTNNTANKSDLPKKATKPSKTHAPQVGSLEYAEQQMKQFTQH